MKKVSVLSTLIHYHLIAFVRSFDENLLLVINVETREKSKCLSVTKKIVFYLQVDDQDECWANIAVDANPSFLFIIHFEQFSVS